MGRCQQAHIGRITAAKTPTIAALARLARLVWLPLPPLPFDRSGQ
jgi:hypothetical protein